MLLNEHTGCFQLRAPRSYAQLLPSLSATRRPQEHSPPPPVQSLIKRSRHEHETAKAFRCNCICSYSTNSRQILQCEKLFLTPVWSVSRMWGWQDVGRWCDHHLLWSWLWNRTSGRYEAKWCSEPWVADDEGSGSTVSSSSLSPWEQQSSSPPSGHLFSRRDKAGIDFFSFLHLSEKSYHSLEWRHKTYKHKAHMTNWRLVFERIKH